MQTTRFGSIGRRSHLMSPVLLLSLTCVYGSQTNYAPVQESCSFPANAKVMQPFSSAYESESAWVSAREQVTMGAWKEYLANLGLSGLDVNLAVSGHLPRVAIAASGGGYRAMLNGAGVVKAMDLRDPSAVELKTGGLLQVATYMAGLSGGAWLTSVLVDQNGVSVDDWSLDISNNLLEPGLVEFATLTGEVLEKEAAGYETSLVDLWGRLLSYTLFPNSDASETVTFSSMAQQSAIADHQFPFPLLIAAAIPNNTTTWSDSVPLEYNVFSSGVVTNTMNAYMQTSLLGTSMQQGTVENGNMCVQGFDNLGWVVGTSSAAFAAEQGSTLQANANSAIAAISPFQATSSDGVGNLVKYTSAVLPNLFKGMYGQLWDNDAVFVGDGGLGPWGNLPFPLLTNPQRNIDVIFAIDSSADTPSNYPNGNALILAAEYSNSIGNPFPAVPSSAQAFLDAGLGQRVSFFGCNDTSVPTIVYIPNRGVSYNSGTSTMKLSYSADEVSSMVGNGFQGMTQGDVPQCVGCMLAGYTGYQSPQCTTCMEKYCWYA